MRRYPVPRPTETAAITAVSRRRAEPVPGAVLLACLRVAYATEDRHGVRLLLRLLARRTGTTGGEL